MTQANSHKKLLQESDYLVGLPSIWFLDFCILCIIKQKKFVIERNHKCKVKRISFLPLRRNPNSHTMLTHLQVAFFHLTTTWMPFRVVLQTTPAINSLVCLSDRPPTVAVLKLFYLRTSLHSWELLRTPNELLFI